MDLSLVVYIIFLVSEPTQNLNLFNFSTDTSMHRYFYCFQKESQIEIRILTQFE